MVIVTQNTIEEGKIDSDQETVSWRKLRERKRKASKYYHSLPISVIIISQHYLLLDWHLLLEALKILSLAHFSWPSTSFGEFYPFFMTSAAQLCILALHVFPNSNSVSDCLFHIWIFYRWLKLNMPTVALTLSSSNIFTHLFLPVTVKGIIISRASCKKSTQNSHC